MSIARQALAFIGRHALLMRATALGAAGTAKESSLRIQNIARLANTGAIQIAESVLAGDRTGVYASTLLVAHKFREALALARDAAEAVPAVVRRIEPTIRHTLPAIRICSIASAALFDSLEIDAGAIATHRLILVSLKEDGTTTILLAFIAFAPPNLAALVDLLTAVRADTDSCALDLVTQIRVLYVYRHTAPIPLPSPAASASAEAESATAEAAVQSSSISICSAFLALFTSTAS